MLLDTVWKHNATRVVRRSNEKTEEDNVSAVEISPDVEHISNRRSTPGSVAFVPSVAGLIIGGEVVKDLTKEAMKRAR